MDMVVLQMPGASHKRVNGGCWQQSQDMGVLGPVLVSLVSWPKSVSSFS